MRSSLRRRVAIHEAGHAVAAVVLNVAFKYVTIEKDDESLGHVLLGPLREKLDLVIDFTPSLRDRIERRVIVQMAGREAEKLLVGNYYGVGDTSDRSQAVDLLSYIEQNEDGVRYYYRWLKNRLDWMVAQPLHRVFIEAVADRLLKDRRLRAADVRAVIAATCEAEMQEAVARDT